MHEKGAHGFMVESMVGHKQLKYLSSDFRKDLSQKDSVNSLPASQSQARKVYRDCSSKSYCGIKGNFR